MEPTERALREFADYARRLDGDEKSEAQLFCERLFQAFGWPGLQEAGARLETRVPIQGAHRKKTTKFADLLWPSDPPRRSGCLIEMKSKGEKLDQHYQQAFEYWQHIVPHRPRYVILCNFDEFWVYDFDQQLYEPVDRITMAELPDRYTALNFLFPVEKKPQFGNDRIAVTRDAARAVAQLFNALTQRRISREDAQRFALRCVVCMFSEDIGLLPKGLFTELVDECRNGESAFDLIGGLFKWMNSRERPKGGRFQGVRYFNGGLFANAESLDLKPKELDLLADAAKENWSKVQPPIFGTLFQGSMDKDDRHAYGAHFSSEADIQKIVLPTIIRPWRERIDAATTLEGLLKLRQELERFQVLDPACGSGNFLYVAYRELVRVEMMLVKRIREDFALKKTKHKASSASFVSIRQFHGIDVIEFAVELAKVTLLLGKKLAYDEVAESVKLDQLGLGLADPLPLDNLDQNIVRGDALFIDWPKSDAIIGNPPFQSKNKMQEELGPAYVKRVREKYPDVPGRADYCVYWIRRAHDELRAGQRAGLVGTNTIRQNFSREGGLDYVAANGGTITEAVSTQVWSGDAVVHVSIVNWTKGKQPGRKLLSWQDGNAIDSPWSKVYVEQINTALSEKLDVTAAHSLRTNADSKACYQGQTHGHEGFLLDPDEAAQILRSDRKNRDVIFPFLNGDDLLRTTDGLPTRYVIDFQHRDLHEASAYVAPFAHVKEQVLPHRRAAAAEETRRNAELPAGTKGNRHHAGFLSSWWQLSWGRAELVKALAKIDRYIVCARVTKRPVFEFISREIRPSDALQVFTLEDDYSFGLLQSVMHWEWFKARCSTLKKDYRYTSDTVFDAFPWPQAPSLSAAKKVARAALDLRRQRGDVMVKHRLSRRELYRQLDEEGGSPIKDAQLALDAAVREAYGMTPKQEVLAFLLALNADLAGREASGASIVGPGLPPSVTERRSFVTKDCVAPSH